MSDRFEIPPNEFGVVRLFEVALDDPAAQAGFMDGKDDETWPVEDALTGGQGGLDRAYVDAIGAGGLEGVGLSSYLTEGVGVAAEELEGDRARLNGLERPVIIVLSAAFSGKALTLQPQPPLRWLGTYGESRAAPTVQRTRNIEGHVAPTGGQAGGSPSGRLMLWAGVVALAVVAVAAVLLIAAGRG